MVLFLSSIEKNVGVEVEEIGRALIGGQELGDGKLTVTELEYLVNLNCSELKILFNTDRDMCIYLLDPLGNLITNGSHVIHGIGCPGINISGLFCGSVNSS